MKEKKRKGKYANTHLSPFVFALQMKMHAFSLEAWCKLCVNVKRKQETLQMQTGRPPFA